MSLLPKIQEVASEHGLILNERTLRSIKDVRYKCPFCKADAGRKGKYYLSLNIEKNVFKCWCCGESGGVLKFMALLTGRSEEEVKNDLFGSRRRKKLHPAEKLTPTQLEQMGFKSFSWYALRKQNPDLYKRNLEWVWAEYKKYAAYEKKFSYMLFLTAQSSAEMKAVCHECAQKLSLDRAELLREFVSYKLAKIKPSWIKQAETLVNIVKTSVSPEPEKAGGGRKEFVKC